MIPPRNEAIKPIKIAFWAYGNIVGQSNAAFAFGINFWEIPLNEGTISAINIRTPI